MNWAPDSGLAVDSLLRPNFPMPPALSTNSILIGKVLHIDRSQALLDGNLGKEAVTFSLPKRYNMLGTFVHTEYYPISMISLCISSSASQEKTSTAGQTNAQ